MILEDDKRLERISRILLQIAGGNFRYREDISERNDEFDAIITGINMLAEELEATTISKEYLESIYRGVTDMLFIVNIENKILKVNSQACDTLKYDEKDLLGNSFKNLLLQKDSREFEKIKKKLREKGSIQNLEKVFKTKEDKIIPISLSFSMLYDNHHRENGILCIAKDISDLKKTEDNLRKKNQELNTFIYKASHDLKGPIASMMGLLNVAELDAEEPEKIKFYLSLLRQSTQKLDAILMDLLELGRITQGDYEPVEIDFNEIIDEIFKSLAHLPELKHTNVQLDIHHSNAFKSEKETLKTILLNLIDNAIKYSGGNRYGANINIEVGDKGEGVVIKISDDGEGMGYDVQQRIFEMFYKGSSRSQGSGMGLYIVSTSVDRLKGELSFNSVLGEGTTFEVYLPNYY